MVDQHADRVLRSAGRVTLKDVARCAGVSPVAVSLALRGSASNSAPTRERIAAAAAALGYVPDPAARALRTRRHGTLGLLVFGSATRDSLSTYGAAVLAVVDAAFRLGLGVHLLHVRRDRSGASGRELDQLLAGAPIDAAVCLGGAAGEAQIEALDRTGRPYVFVGKRAVPGRAVPYVTTDYAAGSRLAVDPLTCMRHRRIALALNPAAKGLAWLPDRGARFRTALRAAGAGPETHPEVEWREDMPVQEIERLLGAGVTALFAADFGTARRVLVTLNAHRIAVPGRLAVVGFGDHPGAASLVPPLTAIRQPMAELGQVAVRLLVERLEGGAPEWPVVLPPTLVVRRSCGGAALLDGRKETSGHRDSSEELGAWA